MSDYTSRNADKFVVRMPEGVREQISAHAEKDRISMNSWIVQAIEERLSRINEKDRLIGALESLVAVISEREAVK